LPGEFAHLIGAGIYHIPLALKADQTTCILIHVVVLYLQDIELFAWKIALTGMALATQGDVKIDSSLLRFVGDRIGR
jgi:hypothetical protein